MATAAQSGEEMAKAGPCSRCSTCASMPWSSHVGTGGGMAASDGPRDEGQRGFVEEHRQGTTHLSGKERWRHLTLNGGTSA
jgi:hypothetical protein